MRFLLGVLTTTILYVAAVQLSPAWAQPEEAAEPETPPSAEQPTTQPAPTETSPAEVPGVAPPPVGAIETVTEEVIDESVIEAGEGEEEEEEEVEVEVITATRTPQKIEQAPSIITVITRRDIQSMGYLSIGEMLRNTVGFGINDNGHWPDTGIRGINDRTTYGDKMIFLVDGHNMAWRQFNRNLHNPTWVDMQDIERVEIIRGPGAALWGSNALMGVVNIVTRDWTSLRGAELTLGADHRFASQMVSARVGEQIGDLSLYANVSYYDDDADSLLSRGREFDLLFGEEFRVEGDEEQGLNISLKAKYEWFKFWFHKSRYDTKAPLSTFSIWGGDDSRFITDRHIVGLTFEKMIFTGFDVKAQFEYDDYRFDDGTVYEDNALSGTASPPTGTVSGGRFLRKMAAIDRRYEWKLQASYVPTLELQALAGAELEYLDLVRWYYPEVWAASNLPTPEFTNVHVGTFVQAQYSPLEMLAVTAGTRFDWDEIYGGVVSPRGGVVLRLPAGFHVKGLFGSAFKGPAFHDLYYFRKNAFYGNPELDPEKSFTGEAEVGFAAAGWLRMNATFFYTLIQDLIGYSSVSPAEFASPDEFPESQRPDPTRESVSQKSNKGDVTTMGVEGEIWLQPLDRVTLRLQGTYRLPRAKVEDGDDTRLPYSSEWTVGGSLTLRLHRRLEATFRGLGVGNKEVPKRQFGEPGLPNWTADEDPTLEAPSYFVGTFVLRAPGLLHKNVDLSLKMDNITNQEHWDAGREVLYPQRKFQAMLWMNASM